MKFRVLILCVVAALVAGAEAQTFSTGFEFEDLDAMADAGWVLSGEAALVSSPVRSGTQALRLPAGALAELPLNGQFGRLNLWVYDEGQVQTVVSNGPQWGLRKQDEIVGAGLLHRPFLYSDSSYAVSNGYSRNLPAAPWVSMTWLNAGTWADYSRGQAGWMHWEIAYNPDGTVVIDLLSDPNGFSGRRSFADCAPFIPAPAGYPDDYDTSVDFADPSSGGCDAIYLHNVLETPAPFGDMVVDDLVWIPASTGGEGGEILYDSFDDGVLDTGAWDGSNDVVEADGVVRLTASDVNDWAQIRTFSRPPTGLWVQVAASTNADLGDHVGCHLATETPDGWVFTVGPHNGKQHAGGEGQLGASAWNPAIEGSDLYVPLGPAVWDTPVELGLEYTIHNTVDVWVDGQVVYSWPWSGVHNPYYIGGGDFWFHIQVRAGDSAELAAEIDWARANLPSPEDAMPGDANLDGDVDLDDFVILKSNFATGSTWWQGDFDLDGDVDLDDFVQLKSHFGETVAP